MTKPIYEIPVTDTVGGRAAAPPSGLLPPPSPLPPAVDLGAPPQEAPTRSRRATESVVPEPVPLAGDWRSAPPPAAAFASHATESTPERAAPSSPVVNEALQPDPALMFALQEVLLHTASDLHVASNAIPMLRVDGALRPLSTGELWPAERVRAALMTLLRPSQREQFAEGLELDFGYSLSANARFRVNYYHDRGHIGAAFRLIPTEIKQLAELGVPDTVARFATLPRGLVLVTGPTGSGKSTTLAAIIDLVNRNRADHIVTIEDPIEYMHINKKALINQREVGNDTHSFAAALKHVLRQDPDVILVGELRDLETISVALTAAETGHLVFATLHTQDAAQTVDRIIDVFPPHQQGQVRTQLASTLQGVVCQTLIKRASGRGRVVATEILVMTAAIGNLIREGKTFQISSAMQAGREAGMYTMDQHLADLANSGQITHQAALDKAHDLEGLKRLISGTDNVSRAPDMKSGIDFGDAYSVQGVRR
jgi:twitching motility protein PilT